MLKGHALACLSVSGEMADAEEAKKPGPEFNPKCDADICKLAQNGEIAAVKELIENGHEVNEIKRPRSG